MEKNQIKCLVWNIGGDVCRITVDDIRFRKLDASCICGGLLDAMQEIEDAVLETAPDADVVFSIMAHENGNGRKGDGEK